MDVKPFGPVQLYVAPDTVEAVKFSVDPSQRGPLLETVGTAGIALTTTVVLAEALLHPLAVVVTEYVPALLVVTLVITGFCKLEVNAFGPVQL